MSMELNYSYYGIPTGRYIYADWDNDIHVADLVNDNMYNLYQIEGTPIADRWGKPFDNSVYLWCVKPDSSFARNCAFCADTGNILNIEVAEHIEQQPVPMTVSCVDRYTGDYGEFNTSPHYRLANNDTKANGFLYNPLAYNIPYTSYCVHAQSGCFDMSTKAVSGRNISELKAWIDANPENRDVWYIAPTLYVGTTTDRRNTDFRASDTNKIGAVLPDILTYRPIPSNAEHVIAEILDGEPEGANWDTKKVYNPFSQAIGQNNFWRGGNLISTYNYQMRIGLQQSIRYSQLKTGYADYSTISPPSKTTGQFFRASSDIQYYDDVAFRWLFKVYDTAAGVFIDNGYDMTNAVGTNTVRLCTVLEIVDYKGQTKGEALVRACRHEIAAIGFYFTDTAADAQSYALGDNGAYSGVYLPIIDGGCTTGYYVTGDAVKDVPYFNATDVSDFKYNPTSLDYDSGDLTTHIKSGGLADGALWYRMNFVEISLLTQWLNTTYKPDSNDLTEDFKGVNPCEYIISVKYYPFNVPYSDTESDVSIGGINVGFDAPTVSRQYGVEGVSYFSLGSFTLQPPYCFGNFLDKYLKLQVYIPYCGFVDLDSSVYCPSPNGTIHTIKTALQVDYATGQCIGLIYRDNLLVDTVQGCCGVDLPLSAIQQGSYQNNIKQAELAIKQAKAGQLKSMLAAGGAVIGTAAAAFTGNVAGVLLGTAATVSAVQGMKNADISRESADYNLEHTAPSVSGVESASPFNNMISEDAARIFIYKPVLLQGANLADYAQTVGYACCKQGKLSSFTGLTICSDAKLNFDAPAAHKAQLQQLLLKGVYV